MLSDNDALLEMLYKILEKIEQCECENDELTKLRDWLLSMFMNGQAQYNNGAMILSQNKIYHVKKGE